MVKSDKAAPLSASCALDMESDREALSGNESDDNKGPSSPTSERSGSRASNRSRSRSRSSSNSSNSDAESQQIRNGRPQTPISAPMSPASSVGNRPQTPSEHMPESPQSLGPASPGPSGDFQGPLDNNHHEDDANSVKSNSTQSSRKSPSPTRSDSSRDSKRGRKEANLDDGNTSDSSESSVDSRRRKTNAPTADTQPEEISEGDMESDGEKLSTEKEPSQSTAAGDMNINHDDLSDVSDLDDSIGGDSDDDKSKEKMDRANSDDEARSDTDIQQVEKSNRAGDDGEEQLDFEAEDGECPDLETQKDIQKALSHDVEKGLEDGESKEEDEDDKKEREDLEEGEVSDEDDARPEETEPRPVCRFFSRGQCTWGASCRFLHPGVTDKGNYTMFELIRPVVPGEFRDERSAYARAEPAPLESAWERGLRTAKEMLRKSMKRKEQDIDFEEKKMNLSLAQEELDKENGYYGRAPSPEPRHAPVEYGPVRPIPEEYYGRRQVIYEPDFAAPPRERVRTYRELPPHRMPDYYNTKYEEDALSSNKSRRTKREVIVQRAEERSGRGDEWSDPWMRSKSPGARKGRKRSYSSGSSYSTSSSSRSSSRSSRSSYRSKSRSPKRRRSRSSRRRKNRAVSPSIIVSERKAANERAALMNPPAPKRKAVSPGMMRLGAQNPPAPSKVDQFGRMRKSELEATRARLKAQQRSSKSSSDSSGSSSSDSESSDSSSSSSRDGSPSRHPSTLDAALALKAKAIDALKSGAEKRQIKLNLKNPVVRKEVSEAVKKMDPALAKKRALSPPGDKNSAANKKATSRREELLKQLKAVEDAIAKKRSKVN